MTFSAFSGLPPELIVVLLATLPFGELRAAIPIGIVGFDLPVVEVFLLAQIGNVAPVLLVFGLGSWWVRWTERRRGFFHRVTHAVLQKAHAKLHGDVSKWGYLALTLFVAVPLPVTGAWTGSLGAFVLGLAFRKAALAIIAGNLISGVIVTLATTGAVAAFTVFL